MTDRTSSPWLYSNARTRRNSTGSLGSKLVPRFDVGAAEKGRVSFNVNENSRTPSNATRSNSIVLEKRHTNGDGQQPSPLVDIYDPDRPKLSLRQRLHHLTWAWYTLPMSTGGFSLLIYAQPHQFTGLRTIGLVIYIINIVIFTIITLAIICRFFYHAGDMTRSVTHPREGFFLPTLFLSIATLITSTERYAIPDHNSQLKWAIQASFWAYVAVTAALAVGQYSYVFAAHSFGLNTMMPTWILPIFPIMLSGTIASVIAETQPEVSAMPIIVAGLTCQGLGLSVALLMYAHMIGRLMQSGLPDREHRPGLFMCVGPPAFTALALIGMARALPEGSDDLLVDKNVIRALALMAAIFLWALSLWWLGIAIVAVVQSPPKYFHLGWWAMVFPNTGFTLATIAIGKELDNESVKWATTGMSIVVLAIFVFVLVNHIRAVLTQDIMYPGRDEDVEDR